MSQMHIDVFMPPSSSTARRAHLQPGRQPAGVGHRGRHGGDSSQDRTSKVLEEAERAYTLSITNCAHGSHGFYARPGERLFESVRDVRRTDGRLRNAVTVGCSMENVVDSSSISFQVPFNADQCILRMVETGTKTSATRGKAQNALETSGNDFAKVFGLCAKVERLDRALPGPAGGRFRTESRQDQRSEH